MFTLASEEVYKDGQVIITEGSSGDWVYVILSGAVEISKKIEGRTVVIERLGEGEVFGELGFLGAVKRTATARAVGETVLGIVDRATLDMEFNKLSTEFRAILSAIVKRFQKMVSRISESERRVEPRQVRTLSLTFKDKGAFIRAYTANINQKGLFIKTDHPLPEGDTFQLKLNLPGLEDALIIKSEVVWVRRPGTDSTSGPPGMGIRFLEMEEKARRNLALYLQQGGSP
ncbi:MAG: TIGR02266 family protein [Deltaproteobacteria bacterium]|nr:TIGR02266 family protein [Deltaproteobacteria bacterium]MBW2129597.1 TIGR02266 family protein [Deltaproteobacteria bacterium]MBW2304277.1 TIGR02266 family protein [Deltaproteobacteria bacterium]